MNQRSAGKGGVRADVGPRDEVGTCLQNELVAWLAMDAQGGVLRSRSFEADERERVVREEPIGADVSPDQFATAFSGDVVEAEVNSAIDAAHADFVGAGGEAVECTDGAWESVRSGIKTDRISMIEVCENFCAGLAEGAMATGVGRKG